MASSRPVDPAVPVGLTLLFHYMCPHCHRAVPLDAPTQAAMVFCPHCTRRFPIVPVDESIVNFIRVMTDDGRAAADQNYL